MNGAIKELVQISKSTDVSLKCREIHTESSCTHFFLFLKEVIQISVFHI